MDARWQRILGYGGFGLVLGLALFALVYVVTTRARIAVRGDPMWATLFLILILGPALGFALWGRGQKDVPPTA